MKTPLFAIAVSLLALAAPAAELHKDVTLSGTSHVASGATLTIDSGGTLDLGSATLTLPATIVVTGGSYADPAWITSLAKSKVGLGNVDNTSDATKNAASATLMNKTINGANNTITIREDDLSLSDVTTANATTSRHGLVKKLPDDATKFYDGTGDFSTPAGGGVLTYVADPTARFAGTYHLGDIVQEIGTPETILLTLIYSGTAYHGGYVDIGDQVNTPYFWFNVDGMDSDPALGGTGYEVDFAESATPVDVTSALAAVVASAGLNYTVTDHGDGTVTLVGTSNFAPLATPDGGNIGGDPVTETTVGSFASNTNFQVIDSGATTTEAGFAPIHSVNDWQPGTLASGAFTSSFIGGLTDGAIVQVQSQGTSGTNAGALSVSVSSSVIHVHSTNGSDSSPFIYLIVHY